MNLENEICRKVFDHHTLLKNDLTAVLLEVGTRAGMSRETIASISGVLGATVDTGTHKMVNDFQKTLKNASK